MSFSITGRIHPTLQPIKQGDSEQIDSIPIKYFL